MHGFFDGINSEYFLLFVLCLICFYGFRAVTNAIRALSAEFAVFRDQLENSLCNSITEGILGADSSREDQDKIKMLDREIALFDRTKNKNNE